MHDADKRHSRRPGPSHRSQGEGRSGTPPGSEEGNEEDFLRGKISELKCVAVSSGQSTRAASGLSRGGFVRSAGTDGAGRSRGEGPAHGGCGDRPTDPSRRTEVGGKRSDEPTGTRPVWGRWYVPRGRGTRTPRELTITLKLKTNLGPGKKVSSLTPHRDPTIPPTYPDFPDQKEKKLVNLNKSFTELEREFPVDSRPAPQGKTRDQRTWDGTRPRARPGRDRSLHPLTGHSPSHKERQDPRSS